jgi:hypothetical protein
MLGGLLSDSGSISTMLSSTLSIGARALTLSVALALVESRRAETRPRPRASRGRLIGTS